MNMSLHPIAEAVRSQGRNGDSMLVHMTPGEVAALQRMAEANGGTLTINPETGQPEAFFLASLLPTIAGALAPSLASAGGILGTLFANPFTTSLTIGGLTGLATGDMQKGLMAGLGAYGGYGLGEALAGASTAMPSVTPAASAAPQANAAIKAAAGRPPIPGLQGAPAVVRNTLPAMPDAATLNQMGGFATSGGQSGFEQLLDPVQARLDPEGALAEMTRVRQVAYPNQYEYAGMFPTKDRMVAAQQQLANLPDIGRTAPPVTYAPSNVSFTQPITQPGATELAGLQSQVKAVPIQTPTQDVMSRIGTQAREMGSGIQSIVSGPPGTGTEFLKDNISNIAMAAAPLAMAESPIEYARNDIQYYYPDFDPTKTGAARYGQRQRRRVTSDGRYELLGAKAGGLMSMAEGGETEYKKTPAEKIASGLDAGGYEMSVTAPSNSQGKGSGKGIDFSGVPAAVKGLVMGLVPGMGLVNAIQGIPGGIQGLMGGTTGGNVSNTSVGLDGYGGGFDPEATGTEGHGPSVGTGLGGLSASDAPDAGISVLASGGIAQAQSYKRGGLKEDSFIVPADVLAALGNGSNNAGLMALNKMLAKAGAPRAEKIDGPGDGKSDSIPTSIEGRQPARVAKDEAYVPTEAVRRLGGGDVKKGAKKLYNLMARVRKAAHGTTKQQRTVNPEKVARA